MAPTLGVPRGRYRTRQKWHHKTFNQIKEEIRLGLQELRKLDDTINENKLKMRIVYKEKEAWEKDLHTNNLKLLEFLEEFFHSNK